MNKNIKNALTIHLLESTQSTDSVRLTPEMQREKVAYSHFSQFVYKEAQKDNIKSILEIEDSILKNDLNRATDKREISSVQAGIDRIKLVKFNEVMILWLTNYQNQVNMSMKK